MKPFYTYILTFQKLTKSGKPSKASGSIKDVEISTSIDRNGLKRNQDGILDRAIARLGQRDNAHLWELINLTIVSSIWGAD